MSTAFKCDRCGKLIADDEKPYLHKTTSFISLLVAGDNPSIPIDLCPMCNNQLVETIRRWWSGLEPD